MRSRVWAIYLSIGGALLTAFVFIHPIRVGPLFNAIGLSASLAIIIGARMNHPRQRLPWYLVATGQALFVAGDVITYNYERFFGNAPPFPSIGDLFYLSVYPFLIAGVLMLVRRRSPGRDRASLIDSLIIAVGVGTLSWVFLLAPYAHDQSLTLLQKLTAMAYPIMDLLLFGVAVRLAVDRGKRPPAFYLMAGAVMVLFTTDTIYTLILLHGTYDNTTGLLELGWGLFYLLWGAAALHTSMVDLDDPAPEGDLQHPRRRLMVLAGASLIAPTVEMIQALRGEQVDVPVLAGCSALLFVLVLVRLNGLMVDIGEYRRTERQMREAEAKYRSLVEGLPAVVYIAEFGKDAAWTYISPKVESILGFTPDEWTGQADLWRERILPEDRELALDAEMRLLNGEPRMHCEYRIIGKNGRVIWIHEEAEALADDGGRPLYLQGVMYDVTEQKNAEAQLVKALAAEKEAATRLRALHEMQNSFLQAVSHDLRTPLTSILGCALTLESSLDQEQISREDEHDLVGRIATNARKLHRLLTNLLDLDRMSRGIVAPNRDDVDVNQILAAVLEESSTDTHSIQITSSGPVHAYVDAAQVERIVENLVVNAIRYTPAGTPIWVRATGDAESVLIVVEDAGPGIPEELRDSIFEPFRQGNEVVTHNPGVGIGLSLVTRFAELHGGRAWVEEREGGGASFRVYLPFASAADESYEGLAPGGALVPRDDGCVPDRVDVAGADNRSLLVPPARTSTIPTLIVGRPEGRSERERMVPEPERGRASDLIQRASELNDFAEYAEAAETSARAIELEPDNALAHTVRAWALENMGGQHVDEARFVYQTAIALDATAPWPRTALADLLHRTGSRDDAERLYRDVAGDPAEALADRPRCLEFRGWSLYRLGRLDEAIQTFHASMAGAPGQISVLFDLALSLLANGRPDEASQAYETAVEAVRAADARRRRAPLTVAVEDLEEAIEAHPELGEISSTQAIRDLLRRELRALGPPGSPPSGGPGGTI